MESVAVATFNASELKNKGVFIFSVGFGKVLLGAPFLQYLFLAQQQYISDMYAVSLCGNLVDAVLTKHFIVYITRSEYVYVANPELSKKKCKWISWTKMLDPRSISIFENTLFIADHENGIYKSADEGMTWTAMFMPKNNWHVVQFIEIGRGYYWSIERYLTNSFDYQLCGYSLNENYSYDEIACNKINLPQIGNNQIDLKLCKLICGCFTDVFVTCYMNEFFEDSINSVVFVFSSNGTRMRTYHSSEYINSLGVDSKCDKLFAGQNRATSGNNVRIIKFSALYLGYDTNDLLNSVIE